MKFTFKNKAHKLVAPTVSLLVSERKSIPLYLPMDKDKHEEINRDASLVYKRRRQ